MDEQVLFHDVATQISQRRCLAFVGAGTGVAAGYPTWSELLNRLEGLAARTGRATPSQLEALRGLPDMTWRAQIYRELLGESVYTRAITDTFDPNASTGVQELHRLLVRIDFRHILTSNYDVVLEQSHRLEFGTEPLSINGLDELRFGEFIAQANQPGHGRAYVHLHGMADSGPSVVLGSQEYTTQYEQHRQTTFARLFALFATHSVVFVGSSLSDPDFLQVLRGIHAGSSGAARHLAILPRPVDDVDLRFVADRMVREYGINVLWYPAGQHHELERLLHQLWEAVQQHKPGVALPASSLDLGPHEPYRWFDATEAQVREALRTAETHRAHRVVCLLGHEAAGTAVIARRIYRWATETKGLFRTVVWLSPEHLGVWAGPGRPRRRRTFAEAAAAAVAATQGRPGAANDILTDPHPNRLATWLENAHVLFVIDRYDQLLAAEDRDGMALTLEDDLLGCLPAGSRALVVAQDHALLPASCDPTVTIQLGATISRDERQQLPVSCRPAQVPVEERFALRALSRHFERRPAETPAVVPAGLVEPWWHTAGLDDPDSAAARFVAALAICAAPLPEPDTLWVAGVAPPRSVTEGSETWLERLEQLQAVRQHPHPVPAPEHPTDRVDHLAGPVHYEIAPELRRSVLERTEFHPTVLQAARRLHAWAAWQLERHPDWESDEVEQQSLFAQLPNIQAACEWAARVDDQAAPSVDMTDPRRLWLPIRLAYVMHVAGRWAEAAELLGWVVERSGRAVTVLRVEAEILLARHRGHVSPRGAHDPRDPASGADPIAAPTGLVDLAEQYVRGRPDDAVGIDLRARALMRQALVDPQGEDSIELLEAALALAREHEFHKVHVDTAGYLAERLVERGDQHRALQTVLEAREPLDQLGELRVMGHHARLEGLALRGLGKLHAARHCYARALWFARQWADTRLQAWAQLGLGICDGNRSLVMDAHRLLRAQGLRSGTDLRDLVSETAAREGLARRPPIVFLVGPPAAGKTTATPFVVQRLLELGHPVQTLTIEEVHRRLSPPGGDAEAGYSYDDLDRLRLHDEHRERLVTEATAALAADVAAHADRTGAPALVVEFTPVQVVEALSTIDGLGDNILAGALVFYLWAPKEERKHRNYYRRLEWLPDEAMEMVEEGSATARIEMERALTLLDVAFVPCRTGGPTRDLEEAIRNGIDFTFAPLSTFGIVTG